MTGTQTLRWGSLVVLGACALLSGCKGGDADIQQFAEPSVEVVITRPESISLTTELPGRVESVRTAEVRARVAGIVLRRHFEEGANVEAGDVLFEIDPRPYRAALARAQAELTRAQAALFEAESVAKRYQSLVEISAVSRQEYETTQANLKTAEAACEAAKAEIEVAELNLEYATVTAPISGRIGRALVTEGALVGQGEATQLALIQQLDPVYVNVRQPVADVLALRAALNNGRLSQADDERAQINVTIDGSDETRSGKLLFSDVSVDRNTGQISQHGLVDNADHLLLPGMYVRVHLNQGSDPQAILVPQRAVRFGSDGKPYVLIAGEGEIVEMRPVSVGTMRGADWYITNGLKADERVIIAGVDSGYVMPGSKVSIRSGAAQSDAAAKTQGE